MGHTFVLIRGVHIQDHFISTKLAVYCVECEEEVLSGYLFDEPNPKEGHVAVT